MIWCEMSLWKLWEPCALSQIWMHGGWEVVHWVGGGERGMQLQSLADTTSLESQAWRCKVGRFRAVLMWKYFVSQWILSEHTWLQQSNYLGDDVMLNCAEEEGQTQKGESGWIQTLWNKSMRRRVNPWHWHHQSSRTLKDIWPET